MTFSELIVLLPCHSLEDFPTNLQGADAESVLAGWSALWHPRLLAAVGRLPDWRRAEPPADTLSGKLIVVPPAVDNAVPSDLPERAQREGGYVVRGLQHRAEIVSALLSALDATGEAAASNPANPPPSVESELVADFLALGTCYLYGELLARRMRYSSTIDAERFTEHVLGAASAAISGEAAEARRLLGLAFNAMVEARGKYYPVDMSLIDVTLVAATTLGPALRRELSGPLPVNLLIAGEVLVEMAHREPASLTALREAINRGTVTLVGGEASEEELPLLAPESIVWQFQTGLAQYQEHLGRRPEIFGRRRFGLTPLLPQILKQLNFRGAVHFTLDDGRFPPGDAAKSCWEGLSGTAIDALTRVPLDANQPGSFTGLAEKLGHAMDHDQVATAGFAHWPGLTSPFYDDLRRATAYAPVLGKFVTLDDYFSGHDSPGMFSRFTPDQYRSPYLQQAVAAGEADPLSRWVRYLTRVRTANACGTLATLASLLRGGDRIDRSLAGEVERAHSSGVAAADLEARLAKQLTDAATQLAGAIPREGRAATRGYLVFNPGSYRRRVLIETSELAALPAEEPPVLAAEEAGGVKRVLVELPPAGFAWVAAAEKAGGKHWSGDPLAGGQMLRNEHCEVTIHPTTGGIQSIYDYRNRANRLSQQIVLRRPERKVRAESASAAGSDEEAVLSRMVAERIDVTSAGLLRGEITSRGQLLDPEGTALAQFTQRVQMTLGSRVLHIELDLEPAAELAADPWNSYFGSRFAWSDRGASLRRDVHLAGQHSTAKRLEAPRFIEIEAGTTRTALLCGGLPFHQRIGQRMLDTLLLVRGETARHFRLGVGVDLPHPWMAALDMFTPTTVHVESAAPPTPARHGWLFHIDARNVVATSWEPLSHGPDAQAVAGDAASFNPEPTASVPAARVTGFRVRLYETEGRAGRVQLRCFRTPALARRTDFEHQPAGNLAIEDDRIILDIAAYEWLEVEAYW